MKRRLLSPRGLLWIVLLGAGAVRAGLVIERWREPPVFDERISLRNLSALHTAGSYQPKTLWYGGVSYLPQALLLELGERLHRTIDRAPAMFGRRNVVTPQGFAVCLSLQAAYGVLSLLFMARLARRFVGDWGATVTAAAVASMPQHLHAGATFKPDILLLALTLWTLDRSFAALGRPSAGRFALAGLGVGLTAATKLNGTVVAIALAIGTLFWLWNSRTRAEAGRARWRIVGMALLAATVSLTTFVAVNRDVEGHLSWARRGMDLYQYKAKKAGEAEGFSPLRMLAQLGDPIYLGRIGGVAAGISALWWVGGAVLAASRKGFRRAGSATRTLILVSFPLAYLLQFAASPRAKPNHLLEIAPLAILPIVALSGRILRATRGWPERRAVVVPTLVAASLVAQGMIAVSLAAETKVRLKGPPSPAASPTPPSRAH